MKCKVRGYVGFAAANALVGPRTAAAAVTAALVFRKFLRFMVPPYKK